MRDGLLHAGGHIRHANIGADAKDPIIHPNEGHAVNLIVKYYHERFSHISLEHVSSLIHDMYKIIKGRVAVSLL